MRTFNRVIIIDDDQAANFVAKFQVKKITQIEAETFSNIRDIPIDISPETLLVLDQNMPEGNGSDWLHSNYKKLKGCTLLYFGTPIQFGIRDLQFQLLYIQKAGLADELQKLCE